MFLTSPLLAAAGAVHGFSVRTGGVSAPPFDTLNLGGTVGDVPAVVDENLRRLTAALGLDASRLATVRQIHGAVVLEVRGTGDGVDILSADGCRIDAPEADALIAHAGTAVGVRTADCVPILMFDPKSGLAAAVHAGWRGTVAHIVVRTVERLIARGAQADSLLAAIGPSIGRCCFEVGEDIANTFEHDPAWGAACVDRTRPRPMVDLPLANTRLLVGCGVLARHIDLLPYCTHCDNARFFSHRRDAGRTGRHLSVIASQA